MLGVGRDLCGSSSPTPLSKQGHLEQAAQDIMQVSFEYLQRRGLHNPYGQPVCFPSVIWISALWYCTQLKAKMQFQDKSLKSRLLVATGAHALTRTRDFQHGRYQLSHTLTFMPLELCHGSDHVHTTGPAPAATAPLGLHEPDHTLCLCGGTPRSAGRVPADDGPWLQETSGPLSINGLSSDPNQAIKGNLAGHPLRELVLNEAESLWLGTLPMGWDICHGNFPGLSALTLLVSGYFLWRSLSETSPPLGERSQILHTLEREFSPLWVNVCTLWIIILVCCCVAIASLTVTLGL